MVERATALDEQLLQDIIHREGVTFLQCTPRQLEAADRFRMARQG